jgi:hypothetical protein
MEFGAIVIGSGLGGQSLPPAGGCREDGSRDRARGWWFSPVGLLMGTALRE